MHSFTTSCVFNAVCPKYPAIKSARVTFLNLFLSAMIKLEAWPEGNYSPNDKPFPRGEIIIGGNTVGHGQYKMPEKTKEDFSTDENGVRWFRTGDIGMMDENGQLVIIGK